MTIVIIVNDPTNCQTNRMSKSNSPTHLMNPLYLFLTIPNCIFAPSVHIAVDGKINRTINKPLYYCQYSVLNVSCTVRDEIQANSNETSLSSTSSRFYHDTGLIGTNSLRSSLYQRDPEFRPECKNPQLHSLQLFQDGWV